MLPISTILKMLKCSRHTLNNLVRLGVFPEPILFGKPQKLCVSGFTAAEFITRWVAKYPQYKDWSIRTARKLRQAAEQARDAC
jgi:hypothetical protein